MSLLLLQAFFLSGCVEQQAKGADNMSGNQTIDAYYCNTDTDCTVKDVHNCCGYYPRCVNKRYTPDIEAVRRECAEEGVASVCGYSEISSCECVEKACTSMQGDAVV